MSYGKWLLGQGGLQQFSSNLKLYLSFKGTLNPNSVLASSGFWGQFSVRFWFQFNVTGPQVQITAGTGT